MRTNSEGQESGQNTVGWPLSAPRCVWGHSWEASKAGEVGQRGAGRLQRFTHSLTCLALAAGCWLGPRLGRQPEHTCVASPCDQGHLTAWHLRVGGLPPSQGPRSQGRSCIAFYDLASEVTRSHFCRILLAPDDSPTRLPRLNAKGISHHFWMRQRQSSRRRAGVFAKCHLRSQVFPHQNIISTQSTSHWVRVVSPGPGNSRKHTVGAQSMV